MKLIEAVRTRAHTLCGDHGHAHGSLNHLHGEQFYVVWDRIWNIPALEVQTSKTENNMVSRATNPEKHIYAETSGVFHFSPEKTRGVEDILSLQSFDQVSSTPNLLGQGGFKTFLKPVTSLPTTLTYTYDKARIDHPGQLPNHDSKESDGREQPDRPDLNLLCSPSRVGCPT